MTRRFFFLFLYMLIFLNCTISYAAQKVVYGSAEYILTNAMNEKTIEQLAMEAARKVAADSAGSLMIGKTTIENNVVKKDEIKVLLRAIAELVPGSEQKHYEIVNKSDNTRKLFYTASFIVDEEKFEKQVKALASRDKGIIQKLEKASKEYEKLSKTEQQYRRDYQTFIKQLGQKEREFVDKNVEELDAFSRIEHYNDLAYENYNKQNFLLAEKCFVEVAKCFEATKKFYGVGSSESNASHAYYNAGMSIAVFDAERAMEHAKKAHELDPYSELPYELMGICAWKQHKFEDAVDYLKQSLGIKYNANVSIKLITLYLSLGELDKYENEKLKLWENNTELLSKTKELRQFEQLDVLKNVFEALKTKNNWNFGKYMFTRSGYDFLDGSELPYDEFCAYQKDSNKAYLVRLYYYKGNQQRLYAIRIMPYENTEDFEKGVWLKPFPKYVYPA